MSVPIPTASSPTNANVAWSASSVTLFSLNRKALYRSVFNDCDKPCYISYGAAAASITNFTVKVAAGAFHVFPQSPIYNNQCTIIWDAAGTGAARTTEY